MADLVLYSYFRSANSYRVRIALALKQIPFEYRPINIVKREPKQTEELAGLNSSSRIPCLVHNGKALGQSLAIVTYLDSVFPEPALFPGGPFERAKILSFCQAIDSDISPLHSLRVLDGLRDWFGMDAKTQTDWAGSWILKGLRELERILESEAGTYCFGDRITAADVLLIPQVDRATRFGVKVAEFPNVSRIYSNCMEVAAFKVAAPDCQPDTPLYMRRK